MINTSTITDATQLNFESEFKMQEGENSAPKISTTCVWPKHPTYKIHILSDDYLDQTKIKRIQDSLFIDDTGERKRLLLEEEVPDSIRSGQYFITLQNNEEVITKVTTVEKETSTKEAAPPAELQSALEGVAQCQTSKSSDFWVHTKIDLPKYPNSPLHTLTKNPLTEDQIKIIQDSIYVENGEAEAPENFTKLIPFTCFFSLNPAIAAPSTQEIYKNYFMSWEKLVSDRINEVQEPVSGALKTLLNNTELLISH